MANFLLENKILTLRFLKKNMTLYKRLLGIPCNAEVGRTLSDSRFWFAHGLSVYVRAILRVAIESDLSYDQTQIDLW